MSSPCAYASALGGESADFVARLIPAAVIGNIVAIISACLLRRLGDRRPELDGQGVSSADRHRPQARGDGA
jgi:malate:Na+ symporter